MDNTSIITQVANPKEEESNSSSQDKGKSALPTVFIIIIISIFFVFRCFFVVDARRDPQRIVGFQQQRLDIDREKNPPLFH